MQRTEIHKNDAKNLLTSFASLLQDSSVARATDIFRSMRDALALDAKRMEEISGELTKLADSYNRYLALKREQETHYKSSRQLAALLGPRGFLDAMKSDKSDAIGEHIEIIPSPAELRESAPLWQHVYQYLRFVPEAQVNEIVLFLNGLQIYTSRQAVESTIRTHPSLFRVKKRGREKFISLKGE